MPTEGPLTEAGLEVWPRGIYDLVTQISREYNHPIIEITESGCGYLDGQMKRHKAAFLIGAASSGTAKRLQNLLAPSPTEPGSAPIMPGHYSTISSGQRGTPSAMD